MCELTRFIEKVMFDSYIKGKLLQNIKIGRCYTTSIKSNKLSDIQNSEILKVAIIGAPNAGKSTLINQIVQRRVFAMSRKVHTTKLCARAIFNNGNKQIVFLDTPGLISSKEFERYNLAKSFLKGGEDAVLEADLIGVVHDLSNSVQRNSLDPKVLRLLHIYKDKESFLVLNKIDTVKSKHNLLEISTKLTGGKLNTGEKEKYLDQSSNTEMQLQEIIKTTHHWENFNDVFMVSAILGNGTNDLRNYLLRKTYPGKWIFSSEQFTDQNPVKIIEEAVRSRLLEHLPEEIPYNLDIELEYLDMDKEELIVAVVLIHCNSERLLGKIKGIRGGRIKMIADEAEQAIADAFLTDVHLRLVLNEKQPKVEKTYNK